MAAEPFDVWLDGIRQQALAAGISRRTVDQALSGLQPIPRVIELDHRQPEGRMTFGEYRSRVVSDQRIQRGAALLQQNEKLLDRMQARYGVPPTVVVALWGVELNFGRTQGSYSVVGALATLAHEGRRASFFRGELLKALAILDHGDVAASGMTGSWAGAMGQCQFMPSTYVAYAVDADGDGRRNISTTSPTSSPRSATSSHVPAGTPATSGDGPSGRPTGWPTRIRVWMARCRSRPGAGVACAGPMAGRCRQRRSTRRSCAWMARESPTFSSITTSARR